MNTGFIPGAAPSAARSPVVSPYAASAESANTPDDAAASQAAQADRVQSPTGDVFTRQTNRSAEGSVDTATRVAVKGLLELREGAVVNGAAARAPQGQPTPQSPAPAVAPQETFEAPSDDRKRPAAGVDEEPASTPAKRPRQTIRTPAEAFASRRFEAMRQRFSSSSKIASE